MKRLLRSLFVFLLLAPLALGKDQQPKTSAKNSGGDSSRPRSLFTLMPKAFQKEPVVDFNVITEVSELGRRAPQPSSRRPIYYLAQSAGFHALGQNAPAGEKPPAVERMEIFMRDSLATAGYLPEAPEHPATIVLIYYWGSYAALSPDATDEANQDDQSGPLLVRELWERSRVVGGDVFARELFKRLQQRHDLNLGSRPPPPDPSGLVEPIPDVMGDLAGNFASFFDPLQQFMDESPKNRHLVEEAFASIYFVITTAYDYQGIAQRERRLLWRTKMSVSADGVSIGETLPPLIANAGAYFGRDMKTAEIIPQRLLREGRVEIGTPTVEFIDEPPADEASTSEKPKEAAKP